MKRLIVAGITCGIGSMLLGARQAGFNVLFNMDWRRYYFRRDEDGNNTFEHNFPEAEFLYAKDDDAYQEIATRFRGKVDVVFGHPECGKYSQMNNNNKNFRSQLEDPGDILRFIDAVATLRPKFFVMDDLPKSFIAVPMEEYAKRLPDYDLFPEWISNYHYGNVQKNRRRMFMVGALKSQRFAFRPGEFEHNNTVKSVIEDLLPARTLGKVPNHDKHTTKDVSAKAGHLRKRDDRPTWGEVAAFFKDKPGGYVLPYVAEDGSRKTRPGTYKGHWEAHAHVLDGGSPAIHPKRGLPYTIRERARIQGFPDDFIFFGVRMLKGNMWNHDKNIDVVKQTGKAMPIQFNRFAAEQIRAHMEKKPFECSEKRLIPRNEYVDQAKMWYCEHVGYSSQKKACAQCWMKDECPRRKK